MSIELKMPKLAMGMNEGTVDEWLVKPGEWVEKAQPIMTVETEKVSYDCESAEAGFLHQLLDEGETVPVETVIGQFFATEAELAAATGGEVTSETANLITPTTVVPDETVTTLETKADARIIASPLARKIARDNGLDLRPVAGSGPKGRIIKVDVEDALAGKAEAMPTSIAAAPAAMTANSMRETARVPMKGMRKTIADRMKQSLQQTAQLTADWDSDITELMSMRNRFVSRADVLGTRVSMNAFIIKAIASAIKEVPVANSCLVDDELVIYETVNMGIAISMPGITEYDGALVVGVLHNIERMGVVEIDKNMKALIGRIRDGQATTEDMTGATITLSSTAGTAPPGTKSTPVLNQPNAALIGISTAIEKPVVVDGEILIRTMMPLCLTFDHCVFDGEPAARFMKALHDCLEHPELMLA
ncbi:MAG: dihydrolipoamide acetyltransferase family protein [Halioglobus sp.]